MTRKPFTPRPYQIPMLEHMFEHQRGANWGPMGVGKTLAGLTYLDALEITDPGPALVAAPDRVAVSTWPDEAEKWDHLRNIEVVPITGNAKQREAALRKPGNVFTINYENVPWLREHIRVNKRDKWPFKKFIGDEATRLKSFRLRQGGKRARALAELAHSRIKYFLEFSGTPASNGLKDLWGQLWFLDRGARLGLTYTAFMQRWFQIIQGGDGRPLVTPLPFAQEQIQDACRDICMSLDVKEYFNLKDPIVTVIRVELPARARALYNKMEKELFIEVEGHQVEAFNSASRTMKCLQLANGAIYTTDTVEWTEEYDERSNWVEVHDAKLQALESVVEEAAGAPILVAYHFKSDLARLLRTFPKGRALDRNPATIREWNAGHIPVLFAHPKSAGHGLNLQDGGNILVFFGHNWNLEEYLQIIERIGPTRQAQAGYDRAMYIYHLVAVDTVDEIVMQRRDSKREVQDLLLAATKRKRYG